MHVVIFTLCCIIVPQPIVSITASSPGYVFLHGSSVTLTCEAVLSPVVDRYASVSLVWGGPRLQLGETGYTVIESGSGLHYTSSLTLSRVKKTDDGDYTCTVRVAGEGNIIGSVVTQSFPFSVKCKFLLQCIYSKCVCLVFTLYIQTMD